MGCCGNSDSIKEKVNTPAIIKDNTNVSNTLQKQKIKLNNQYRNIDFNNIGNNIFMNNGISTQGQVTDETNRIDKTKNTNENNIITINDIVGTKKNIEEMRVDIVKTNIQGNKSIKGSINIKKNRSIKESENVKEDKKDKISLKIQNFSKKNSIAEKLEKLSVKTKENKETKKLDKIIKKGTNIIPTTVNSKEIKGNGKIVKNFNNIVKMKFTSNELYYIGIEQVFSKEYKLKLSENDNLLNKICKNVKLRKRKNIDSKIIDKETINLLYENPNVFFKEKLDSIKNSLYIDNCGNTIFAHYFWLINFNNLGDIYKKKNEEGESCLYDYNQIYHTNIYEENFDLFFKELKDGLKIRDFSFDNPLMNMFKSYNIKFAINILLRLDNLNILNDEIFITKDIDNFCILDYLTYIIEINWKKFKDEKYNEVVSLLKKFFENIIKKHKNLYDLITNKKRLLIHMLLVDLSKDNIMKDFDTIYNYNAKIFKLENYTLFFLKNNRMCNFNSLNYLFDYTKKDEEFNKLNKIFSKYLTIYAFLLENAVKNNEIQNKKNIHEIKYIIIRHLEYVLIRINNEKLSYFNGIFMELVKMNEKNNGLFNIKKIINGEEYPLFRSKKYKDKSKNNFYYIILFMNQNISFLNKVNLFHLFNNYSPFILESFSIYSKVVKNKDWILPIYYSYKIKNIIKEFKETIKDIIPKNLIYFFFIFKEIYLDNKTQIKESLNLIKNKLCEYDDLPEELIDNFIYELYQLKKEDIFDNNEIIISGRFISCLEIIIAKLPKDISFKIIKILSPNEIVTLANLPIYKSIFEIILELNQFDFILIQNKLSFNILLNFLKKYIKLQQLMFDPLTDCQYPIKEKFYIFMAHFFMKIPKKICSGMDLFDKCFISNSFNKTLIEIIESDEQTYLFKLVEYAKYYFKYRSNIKFYLKILIYDMNYDIKDPLNNIKNDIRNHLLLFLIILYGNSSLNDNNCIIEDFYDKYLPILINDEKQIQMIQESKSLFINFINKSQIFSSQFESENLIRFIIISSIKIKYGNYNFDLLLSFMDYFKCSRRIMMIILKFIYNDGKKENLNNYFIFDKCDFIESKKQRRNIIFNWYMNYDYQTFYLMGNKSSICSYNLDKYYLSIIHYKIFAYLEQNVIKKSVKLQDSLINDILVNYNYYNYIEKIKKGHTENVSEAKINFFIFLLLFIYSNNNKLNDELMKNYKESIGIYLKKMDYEIFQYMFDLLLEYGLESELFDMGRLIKIEHFKYYIEIKNILPDKDSSKPIVSKQRVYHFVGYNYENNRNKKNYYNEEEIKLFDICFESYNFNKTIFNLIDNNIKEDYISLKEKNEEIKTFDEYIMEHNKYISNLFLYASNYVKYRSNIILNLKNIIYDKEYNIKGIIDDIRKDFENHMILYLLILLNKADNNELTKLLNDYYEKFIPILISDKEVLKRINNNKKLFTDFINKYSAQFRFSLNNYENDILLKYMIVLMVNIKYGNFNFDYLFSFIDIFKCTKRIYNKILNFIVNNGKKENLINFFIIENTDFVEDIKERKTRISKYYFNSSFYFKNNKMLLFGKINCYEIYFKMYIYLVEKIIGKIGTISESLIYDLLVNCDEYISEANDYEISLKPYVFYLCMIFINTGIINKNLMINFKETCIIEEYVDIDFKESKEKYYFDKFMFLLVDFKSISGNNKGKQKEILKERLNFNQSDNEKFLVSENKNEDNEYNVFHNILPSIFSKYDYILKNFCDNINAICEYCNENKITFNNILSNNSFVLSFIKFIFKYLILFKIKARDSENYLIFLRMINNNGYQTMKNLCNIIYDLIIKNKEEISTYNSKNLHEEYCKCVKIIYFMIYYEHINKKIKNYSKEYNSLLAILLNDNKYNPFFMKTADFELMKENFNLYKLYYEKIIGFNCIEKSDINSSHIKKIPSSAQKYNNYMIIRYINYDIENFTRNIEYFEDVLDSNKYIIIPKLINNMKSENDTTKIDAFFNALSIEKKKRDENEIYKYEIYYKIIGKITNNFGLNYVINEILKYINIHELVLKLFKENFTNKDILFLLLKRIDNINNLIKKNKDEFVKGIFDCFMLKQFEIGMKFVQLFTNIYSLDNISMESIIYFSEKKIKKENNEVEQTIEKKKDYNLLDYFIEYTANYEAILYLIDIYTFPVVIEQLMKKNDIRWISFYLIYLKDEKNINKIMNHNKEYYKFCMILIDMDNYIDNYFKEKSEKNPKDIENDINILYTLFYYTQIYLLNLRPIEIYDFLQEIENYEYEFKPLNNKNSGENNNQSLDKINDFFNSAYNFLIKFFFRSIIFYKNFSFSQQENKNFILLLFTLYEIRGETLFNIKKYFPSFYNHIYIIYKQICKITKNAIINDKFDEYSKNSLTKLKDLIAKKDIRIFTVLQSKYNCENLSLTVWNEFDLSEKMHNYMYFNCSDDINEIFNHCLEDGVYFQFIWRNEQRFSNKLFFYFVIKMYDKFMEKEYIENCKYLLKDITLYAEKNENNLNPSKSYKRFNDLNNNTFFKKKIDDDIITDGYFSYGYYLLSLINLNDAVNSYLKYVDSIENRNWEKKFENIFLNFIKKIKNFSSIIILENESKNKKAQYKDEDIGFYEQIFINENWYGKQNIEKILNKMKSNIDIKSILERILLSKKVFLGKKGKEIDLYDLEKFMEEKEIKQKSEEFLNKKNDYISLFHYLHFACLCIEEYSNLLNGIKNFNFE